MPRIIPEPRYFSMPSIEVGARMCNDRDSTGRDQTRTASWIGGAGARTTVSELVIVTRRFCDNEHAEEAVLFVQGPGGEEKRIRRTVGRGAFAEGERPETLNEERRPVGGVELAALLRLAVAPQRPSIEGVDLAVAEVSHE